MARYKLIIEYDGGPYCGWQRQADRMSVQQALEEAIAGFSGETVVTQAAGRTDAGVHALGQVVTFDLMTKRDPFKVREALNYHLKPHPIAVVSGQKRPRTISRPVFRRWHSTTSTASSTAGPGRRSMRGGCGTCRSGSMPTPCTRRRSLFSAGTISPRSARRNARRNRQSGRLTGSMCRDSSTW